MKLRPAWNFIVLLVILLLCAGCSQTGSTPQWQKSIPGLYQGDQAGFRELIDLRPDGMFRHEVFIEEKSVLAESGKWSYEAASGAILVEPFTSFFDERARTTTRKGKERTEDVLLPLREGSIVKRISPSVDF